MVAEDRLKTDEERLGEAARFAAAVKRADRIAIYAAVLAGVAAFIFVYGYLWNIYDWVGEYAFPMLTFVFGPALIAKNFARAAMYRIEKIGEISWFGVGSGRGAVGKPDYPTAPTDQWPAVVTVPRHDAARPARGLPVLMSPLREGPSIFVTPGGRAAHPVDQLPMGVAAMTLEGFVFYPDADAQSVHAISELKGVAWELAKDSFKVLGVLGALGFGEREPVEPALPEWVTRSRAHPDFYSFAWTELVEVRWSAGVVTMTHEAADAPRASHVFTAADARWPILLMKLRLERDTTAVLVEKVWQPKAAELAPALLDQFRGIYGDRISEQHAAMNAELHERVSKAVGESALPLDAIAKEGLASILPAFGKYQEIVKAYPILFGKTPA